MKHVYGITFHKNEEQLLRLINALNDKDVFFVIHVCKNFKYFDLLKSRFINFNNVYFCDRVRASWNTYHLLLAHINTLETAVNEISDFDFFSSISAQDYPIKSKKYIRNYLEKNIGKTFMSSCLIYPTLNEKGQYYYPVKDHWTSRDFSFKLKSYYIRVFKNYYVLLPGELDPTKSIKSFFTNSVKRFLKLIIPPRKFLDKYTPYIGPNWFTMSNVLCAFIISNYSKNMKFNAFWKYVFGAEEIWWQTIIMNSPYKDNVVNENLRLVIFDKGPHPINLNKSHIKLIEDAPAHKLFARKFDISVDADILDMIDEKILAKKPIRTS